MTSESYQKPSLKKLRAECAKFNAACKVGGHVRLKVDGSDTPHYTITTAEAQVLSGHSPVVWMEGISGCYLLSHVTPVTEEEWKEGMERQEKARHAEVQELDRLRSEDATCSPRPGSRPIKVFTLRRYAGETKYVRELLYERATFHAFGTDYEEFESGPGPYSIAIVELPDGIVITPRADMIQFLDAA